ncbi:WSS1-like protein [Fusarium circinatum]|uniref:WSS1-like protein n=1 Tax=Fusarium circinatum TaxID=48490 RepID=A0A8H5X6S9_FUSCI|nr:WSS1-like protein [Fusarium circinatum]
MAEQKDRWSTNAYQHSASFVPKLATKVVQWLDLQKDDVLLDIGCGDGILNAEFAKILAQGSGSMHGIDSSASMIEAARELCKDSQNSTFDVLDATQLVSKPELQKGAFTKAFSNAAMHWILRPEDKRAQFFEGVYASLAPGGTFVFEMGGFGNVSEMRTAALSAVGRRIGMKAALAADPWFFPDEAWVTKALQDAGFVVERAEREWRPTPTDKGGVEGWIRLMASQFLDTISDEKEREEAVQECVGVLREITLQRHDIIMPEHDALVLSYSHLAKLPRANDALQTLKKVASLVKPIMRARNWKVRELAEFYPEQHNLLGLNINRGAKICLRLRHAGDKNQFMPIESVVDTMLHELSHIVHGPHDAKFHALWDQLRDEHEGLVLKGYTGEGFLSEGRRLGGSRIPPLEARRVAREAAEKRRARPGTGSGKRLGGSAPRPGEDIRRVIADAAERRSRILKGCGTDNLSETQIRNISDNATKNGFRTRAEEDEANDAAIAQAMWELVQEDKSVEYGNSYIAPTADNPTGNGGGSVIPYRGPGGSSERSREPPGWTCSTCTLHNPANYLCCDACGMERSEMSPRTQQVKNNRRSRSPVSQPAVIDLTTSSPPRDRQKSATTSRNSRPRVTSQEVASSGPQMWDCSFCGTVMEKKWWTCSTCGKIKDNSR